MEKITINPRSLAPPTNLAYSHGVKAGHLVFVAGQVGRDSQGRMAIRDIGRQCEQAFENIKAILAEFGATLGNVVKLNLYMVDMEHNYNKDYLEVRARYLKGNQLPAATLVEVKSLVPKEALIEIEAIAMVD